MNAYAPFRRTLVSLILLFCATTSLAQTKTPPRFVSNADQELTLNSITIAPFVDNLSGIYAKPLTESMQEMLSQDPRWNLLPFPNRAIDPLKLDANPSEVQKILRETKADALLTGRVQKGSLGISVRLTLYVGGSGLPLLSDETTETERFETEQLKQTARAVFRRMRSRLPFRGRVKSRRGQEVTVDIGRNSNLHEGSQLDIIQILKINRHPKLHLMISTEKEILGKVRVTKADDELSFGQLTYEKEAGLIVPGMKVLPDTEAVNYPEPAIGPNGKTIPSLGERADKNVAFGDKPVAWLPEPTPQYGRVQVLAGLGQYNQTVTMANAGATGGGNGAAPEIGLMGEAWLNREWRIGVNLRKSSFGVDNNLAGSTPSRLNMSVSKYDISAGYSFFFSNDLDGPAIQLSAGLGKFSVAADQSSPVLFSNMDFGGPILAANFVTDFGPGVPWDVGAKFKYYYNPSVNESVSSGAHNSVSASDFSFQAGYRVRRNFRYIGEVDFEYYNANFDGNGDRPDPVSTIGHKLTSVLVGLEYSF